ncbi:MAG: glycosyltransferase family 4 protein [Candidatus Anstonellales archaeon]
MREVLILTHEYPPYIFGGVSSYMKEMVKFLSLKGFKVHVVTGRSDRKSLRVESLKNITFYRIYFPEVPIRSIWYSYFSKEVVLKIIEKVDVIIANALDTFFLYRILNCYKQGQLKKKIITLHHGSLESIIKYYKNVTLKDQIENLNLYELLYYSMLPIYRILLQKDLSQSTRLITVARHVVDELASEFPDMSHEIISKSSVIYGGIDFNTLSKFRTKFRNSCNKNVIIYGYVGRLFLLKGVKYAVEAFELIQRHFSKNSEMWIFGEGPLKKWINRYAKTKELNIKTFGHLPQVKLYTLISKYVDVMIFPSLYEGCPYTILEANAFGVPVVTWDLSWSREFIINGTNGFRVKHSSIDDLATYSIKALDLKNKEAVVFNSAKFDKNKTFTGLVELF